jgi:hypothetical protein
MDGIGDICGFAKCSHGMYMYSVEGFLYKLDTGEYDHSWVFETDLITNGSCDIKHIEKIQMFCDISEGTSMSVYFLYDEDDIEDMLDEEKEKRKVWSVEDASHDIQKVIRVKPRMTAHHGFKVHVEGNGFVRIRSMELLVQGGGELYV